MQGLQVGQLSKKWSGCLQECYTDEDKLSMSFPVDLDVKMKAVLMGAAVLIVSSHNESYCNYVMQLGEAGVLYGLS
jgi:hypothetical protein